MAATGATGATGPTGAAGVSNAYSAHSTGDISTTGTLATVGTLTIPTAGNYVITATLNMGEFEGLPPDTYTDTCELLVGSTFAADAFPVITGTLAGPGTPDNVSMQTVQTYAGPGTASVECLGIGAFVFGLRITAIQVGSLTDTGF